MTATPSAFCITAAFADLRARLLRWSELDPGCDCARIEAGNMYEEIHDEGRAILAATPATVAEANLRAYVGLLLAFGPDPQNPLALPAEYDEIAMNAGIVEAFAEAIARDVAAAL